MARPGLVAFDGIARHVNATLAHGHSLLRGHGRAIVEGDGEGDEIEAPGFECVILLPLARDLTRSVTKVPTIFDDARGPGGLHGNPQFILTIRVTDLDVRGGYRDDPADADRGIQGVIGIQFDEILAISQVEKLRLTGSGGR